MTPLRQFTAAATGSDLLPQIKQTRVRLAVLVSVFLAIFLFSHLVAINTFLYFVVSKQVPIQDIASIQSFDPQHNPTLAVGLLVTTVGIWLIMSYISWMLLYLILKPVSESIKEREQFINNARHELRTPLTILKSEIELFADYPLQKEARLDLNGIKLQVDRLIDLSQNLLSSLEKPTDISAEEIVNLHDAIHRIDLTVGRIYAHKHIIPNIEIDNDTKIKTNHSLCNQLLTNIIENAYKHGLSGTHLLISFNPQTKNLEFTNMIDTNETTHKSGIGVQAAQAISAKIDVGVSHISEKVNYHVIVDLNRVIL